MKDGPDQLQLFDLMAREWTAPGAVTDIAFNDTGSAVAFGCATGAIAIAATADAAGPDSRIRRAADSAQLMIQPRSGPYPALRHADHTDGRSSTVGRHQGDSFLFGKATGRMNTVSAGGLSMHLPPKGHGPVLAIAAAQGAVAYAIADSLHVWSADQAPVSQQTPTPIATLRYAPDASTLACGHAGGVMLWTPGSTAAPRTLPIDGCPVALEWSRNGRYLACCLGPDGLAIIDVAAMQCTVLGQFPAPVTSAGFTPDGTAVVASGAYRVTAWSLGPPLQSILTGKPGLVLIDRIAACPTRNLVAVGYANGLLSLAEIGRADEILLRQDTGFAISALEWSADGRMLAVGSQDGTAALIEFPDVMFKT
jgi:WD40 repeat protein